MGVTGLWKQLVDSLKKVSNYRHSPTDIHDIVAFAIDSPVIFCIIWFWKQFGSRVFKASNYRPLAKEFAALMSSYIEELLPDAENLHWLFEGPKPEKAKKRNINSARKLAKTFNKAVNMAFLSTKNGHERIANGILNRAFFPPPKFTEMVMYELLALNKGTVLQAAGESDYAISRLCNERKTIVVSSDSDFLVFSKCDALINPTYKQVDDESYINSIYLLFQYSRYRCIVNRQEMLRELNCNEAQLKVAAAFSGQDHIAGVGGFGIKKTLDRIRNINSP